MNASQLTPYVCPRLRSSKNDRGEAGGNKRSGCMTADVSGSASLATLILSPLEENLRRVLICGASRHDL